MQSLSTCSRRRRAEPSPTPDPSAPARRAKARGRPDPISPAGGGRVLRDESGAIYVEYIVLTLLVAIGVSWAIIAVAVSLLEHFKMTQAFLGAPIP